VSSASTGGARATVGAWLAGRTPPPPPLLGARITLALGDATDDDVADTARVCLEAAQRVLRRLIDAGGGERGEAADLLAADALVTYALEFAAEVPDQFAGDAAGAMTRLGGLYGTVA
jgi:uncharacterized membrane protein